MLNGLKRDNVLSEDQAKEIMDKANVSKHRSVLSTQFSISSKAFPSIIKSAVDFWVYKTGDIDRIKHLIPYIQGEKTCEDILYLYLFKELPYPTEKEQATHMIHIEGSKSTGLLYALMEYYGIYTYIVVLDGDYYDEDINMTYAYDPVSSKVIDRKFSLPLTLSHLDEFIKMPYNEYASYFDCIEQRIESILAIWQRKSDEEALNKVIENAFSSIPEGTIIDDSTLDKIVKEIFKFFESKIKQSSGKDK